MSFHQLTFKNTRHRQLSDALIGPILWITDNTGSQVGFYSITLSWLIYIINVQLIRSYWHKSLGEEEKKYLGHLETFRIKQ